MATRMLVAILAPVDAAVLCVGTGIAAGDRGVLVHPTLSRRLHAGTGPSPTHVVACTWTDPDAAPGRTMTTQVTAVHVSSSMLTDPRGGAPEPIVGLELAGPLAVSGEHGFRTDADLLTHLRDPFTSLDPLASPATPDDPRSALPRPSTSAPGPVTPPVEFTPPEPPDPPPIESSDILCRFLSFWC